MNFKLNLIILWVRLTFENVFNKRNFAFYNFSTLPWETNHIVFSFDKIREQVRGEMENIGKKITEEGMLIPNSITWTSFLLITVFQSAFTNMMTCVKKLPLKSFNNLWTIVTYNRCLVNQETGVRKRNSREKNRNGDGCRTQNNTDREPM